MKLTALTAVLAAACGADGGPGEGTPCGPNGACATGFTCAAASNLCSRSVSAGDAGVADAPPVPDAGPPCPNLLVNGGFEQPGIAQDTDVYSTDPTFLPGWTLSAGAQQFFLEHGAPGGVARHAEGSQAICLNGDGAPNVFIEQSFATTIGTRYWVFFSLTDEQVAGPSAAAVLVEVAGMAVTFDRTNDNGYGRRTFAFVATAATTTLRISDATPGSIPASSPMVDDVVVSCTD